jgi:Flp pilus assembly protein TadG
MKTKRAGISGRRGFALIYLAIALVVLTVFCGLAVDATVLFLCRAKLSAAVDASVLAGARSVILTDTPAAAQTQALTAAGSFFTANFPSGYMGSQAFTMPAVGSSNANFSPTFNWNSTTGIITVSVNASVNAPLYFMRVLPGMPGTMTINVSGSSQRRGLVMMLVLDVSSSMGTRGTGSSCDAMVTAAESFVNSFSPTDYIGLITFNLTATLNDAPTTNHAQVYADIDAISCGSNTNTITAMEMAYGQIKAMNQPLALNTIVLFTDGSPNGITATFPARAAADTRYGPQYVNPPAAPNVCGDNGPSSYGNNNEELCNMPVLCSNANDSMFGAIAQWGNQNSWGATTVGLAQPADYGSFTATNTDNAISLPTSCGSHQSDLSSGGTSIRQFAAYIPDTDFYGNNLRHGVVATSAPAQGTLVGGYDSRETWLHQVNNTCYSGNCKNTGDYWANYPAIGTETNFIPAGPYLNHLRLDQPNTIVAASMNGVMSAAYTIRSDTTYNPVINTIYLTGNGEDSVDREFLPIVANVSQITALPYDDPSTFVAYPNPAYQSNQPSGKYLVTSDKSALGALFAQLASELLHLSH